MCTLREYEEIIMDYRNNPKFDPLKFVHELKPDSRTVLFYGNRDYAREIQYEFLKKSLDMEENAVFVSLEDKYRITKEMEKREINSKKYVKSGFLHIFQVSSPIMHKNGIYEEYQKCIVDILDNVKHPLRFTDDLLWGLSSEHLIDKISDIIKLENLSNIVNNNSKTMLCAYPVDIIPLNKRPYFITALAKSHDYAIYSGDWVGFGINNSDFK